MKNEKFPRMVMVTRPERSEWSCILTDRSGNTCKCPDGEDGNLIGSFHLLLLKRLKDRHNGDPRWSVILPSGETAILHISKESKVTFKELQ